MSDESGQDAVVRALVKKFGGAVFKRQQLLEAQKEFPRKEMAYIWRNMEQVSRGVYSIEKLVNALPPETSGQNTPEPITDPVLPDVVEMNAPAPVVEEVIDPNARVFDLRNFKVIAQHADQTLVPVKDPGFIPFGPYQSILKIIQGKTAYLPVYIFGDTGYGKTKMIEQACAAVNRELVEVSITEQTTEEDLIGKYRLIDGTMIWEDGPVLIAMKRGAVLLLDEVDYATPRATSELQMVLRFRRYFIKKTGEMVKAKSGFTVLATGNTSGRGEGTGEFVGAGVLNRAFRERFRAVIRHSAPDPRTELKILSPYCKSQNTLERLVFWAEAIRKTKSDGGVMFEVTTARLISICELMQVFDEDEAVKAGLSNFFSEDFETAAYKIWINLKERKAQQA